jgi:hypothetical protein
MRRALIISAIFLCALFANGCTSNVGRIKEDNSDCSLSYFAYKSYENVGDNDVDNGDDFLLFFSYENYELELLIEFPYDWYSRHSIEQIVFPIDETIDGRVGRVGIDVRTSWGGLLFQIIRYPMAMWNEWIQAPVRNEIILESNEHVFVMYWPGDVHWRDSYEHAVYNEMSEQISSIRFSLYIR